MAKILVVDDEVGIRELLEEILTDEGHIVVTAENAAQATIKLREHRPDLVLLDIWLPDQDGIELHANWCNEHLAVMPVVVMSGHATIEHAITATRQGAADFLEKPISLPKLLSVVENVLAVRRPRNRILQLSDFASIETFRFFGRRLSQASLRSRVIYLEGADDWIGELCAQTLCSSGGKMIRLDRQNDPIYLNDIKSGSVFFSGELVNLTKLQLKNVKFIAENLAKKQFHLIVYSQSTIDHLVDLGGDRLTLQQWMSNAVRVPALASLSDQMADLALILLSYYTLRGEAPDRQLSTEAANALAESMFSGNYGDFAQKVRSLANYATANVITEREVQEVFQITEEERGVLPFSLDLPYREVREQFEQMYFQRLIKQENGVMSRIAERSGIERTHLYRKLKQIGVLTGSDKENENKNGKEMVLEDE